MTTITKPESALHGAMILQPSYHFEGSEPTHYQGLLSYFVIRRPFDAGDGVNFETYTVYGNAMLHADCLGYHENLREAKTQLDAFMAAVEDYPVASEANALRATMMMMHTLSKRYDMVSLEAPPKAEAQPAVETEAEEDTIDPRLLKDAHLVVAAIDGRTLSLGTAPFANVVGQVKVHEEDVLPTTGDIVRVRYHRYDGGRLLNVEYEGPSDRALADRTQTLVID